MPIGSLIRAGTGIVSGFMQRSAANRAAEQSAQAREAAMRRIDGATTGNQNMITDAARTAAGGVTDAASRAATGAIAAATGGRDRILESLQGLNPYRLAGSNASSRVDSLTADPVGEFSYDPSKVGTNPAYQFRQREANKAMLANGAAFGNLQSGGFARAFQDRNQEAASQEYEADFNRELATFGANQGARNTRIAQLMQTMGVGLNAENANINGMGDASRLEYQGAIDAGNYDTEGATRAGMFGTAGAGDAARLGQGAAEFGAGLMTDAGDSRAVGTVNQSNATTGIMGQVGNVARSIDWSSIFRRNQQPQTAVI